MTLSVKPIDDIIRKTEVTLIVEENRERQHNPNFTSFLRTLQYDLNALREDMKKELDNQEK